ncbi:Protein phosphatase 2C 1 [Geranomyces variabilis]|uniref:Protein phosphatase 2C 1 n=1 Tax=Geranomyces variabilis TaxID=109894 RepID=A0AAD5XS07_9FUNG|nr:Protein phosphatase 2C 1 [Geranomyces variabilis]
MSSGHSSLRLDNSNVVQSPEPFSASCGDLTPPGSPSYLTVHPTSSSFSSSAVHNPTPLRMSSGPSSSSHAAAPQQLPPSPAPGTTLLDELAEPKITTVATPSASAASSLGKTGMMMSVGEFSEDAHAGHIRNESSTSAGGSTVSGAEAGEELWKTSGFKIGFAEDKNKKYRRTMEDAHAYFYNFGKSNGSGWFAIFDGHAGKSAADWCGEHMHENFEKVLHENPTLPVPDLLNRSFLLTDQQLGERKGSYSGCTAVVGYIRTEERAVDDGEHGTQQAQKRRVLYTANAGDARAVLCRDGKAIRLSYDHKGSDPAEAKRIVESGGFVMNNRVNGVLAVTRSLGDISMKEWVIGSPYTTETVLDEKDSFLILACDGIWDVCSDQTATDLIREVQDPQEAAEDLLDYALENFTTDNLSVLIVRLDQTFVP